MQCSRGFHRAVLYQAISVVLFCATLVPPLASPVHSGSDSGNPPDEPITLEDVRRHIDEKGYSWSAGETSLSELRPHEFARRMGTRLPDDYDEILEHIRTRAPALPEMDLPSRFDWCD